MTAKATPKRSEAPQLSRTQIDEVLKILKDVDSVELKFVAPMQTITRPSASSVWIRSKPRYDRSIFSTRPAST